MTLVSNRTGLYILLFCHNILDLRILYPFSVCQVSFSRADVNSGGEKDWNERDCSNIMIRGWNVSSRTHCIVSYSAFIQIHLEDHNNVYRSSPTVTFCAQRHVFAKYPARHEYTYVPWIPAHRLESSHEGWVASVSTFP